MTLSGYKTEIPNFDVRKDNTCRCMEKIFKKLCEKRGYDWRFREILSLLLFLLFRSEILQILSNFLSLLQKRSMSGLDASETRTNRLNTGYCQTMKAVQKQSYRTCQKRLNGPDAMLKTVMFCHVFLNGICLRSSGVTRWRALLRDSGKLPKTFHILHLSEKKNYSKSARASK